MEKTSSNLGHKKDKILVFGGVYGNLQALEALQNVANAIGISAKNIICTGDVVAYCAQPKECVELIKNWGIHCIAGNVELNLVNDVDDCGCNFEDGSRCDVFSRLWYPYLKNQLKKEHIDWMANLPELLTFAYADKHIAVVHGSYFNTSEFIFKSTPWENKQPNFKALNADVILAGHCGIPYEDEKDGKLWLNAGVIGMPANDGTPNVWYALLDDADEHFSFKIYSLNYDFETAAQQMKDKPLPQTYAKTLKTGIWDNCEILPKTEAALQGRKISF